MTNPRLRAALAAALLVTACQGGTPTGSSATATGSAAPTAAAQSPTPGPSAGRTPAPTAIAERIRLQLDDRGPILTSQDGPPGSRYVLPAAGARARDGSYVLVIVWFGDEQSGEQPKVTVATSRDGTTWKVDKTPLFEDLGVGTARPGPGPIPTAIMQLDDGSWLLWGWASEASDPRSFGSWRASAPKLAGPWKLDAGGILVPGRSGTWDDQTAAIGAVQRTNAGFAAWYEGQPHGDTIRGDLGYATSPDGLAWQKHDDPATTAAATAESDPIMYPGICGEPTARGVFQPSVEVEPDGYLMVFGAYGNDSDQMDLFGALSADGLAWECGAPTALLKGSDIPGSEGIHTVASFPMADARVGVLVESLGSGVSEIWLATAERLP